MDNWALERASIIYSNYKAGVLESLNAAIVQSLHEAEDRGAKRGRAEGVAEIRAAFKNGDVAPITARGAEVESMVAGEEVEPK